MRWFVSDVLFRIFNQQLFDIGVHDVTPKREVYVLINQTRYTYFNLFLPAGRFLQNTYQVVSCQYAIYTFYWNDEVNKYEDKLLSTATVLFRKMVSMVQVLTMLPGRLALVTRPAAPFPIKRKTLCSRNSAGGESSRRFGRGNKN